MGVYETILRRRSIRKFEQTKIEDYKLKKMINAARLAPSGANLQPLKYIVVSSSSYIDKVFDTTRWAAYISPHGTPKEGERPTAYIIVLMDSTIRKDAANDASAAIVNIILTAWEDNVASCWIGSIDKVKLREILEIEEKYEIHSLVALGFAAQESEFHDIDKNDDSIKYYLDEDNKLHVPKRKLDEIARFI